ncbi:MAG: hypothetical protein KDH94_06690, partial [Coxiellaceae bacterium]|nr:hypothetical protein [Coxiellaceae bacterium]
SALGVEKSVDEWKAAVRAAARINRIGAAAANNAYTKTNNYAKLSVILEKFKALKQAAHQYEVDVDQCVKLFDEAWEAYCQIPLKRADYVLTLQPQFVELVSLLKSEEARKIYLDKLNLVKSTSDLNLDSVMLYVALQPESGVFLAKLLSVLNQSSEALEAQAKPNLSANNVDTEETRKKLEFLKATLASQSVLYKAISNFTIIIGKESVDVF